MKTLADLLSSTEEEAWPEIEEAIADGASNNVEVVPVHSDRQRQDALLCMQVSTRSYLGAVCFHSGGLLVDYGWIRVLGSGGPLSSLLQRSISSWNMGKFSEDHAPILIGDDVIGGIFAFNRGTLGEELGHVYYLPPSTLHWESTSKKYSDWLLWVIRGDLGLFYKGCRWEGWEDEVAQVNGDQGVLLYPFLFTSEARDASTCSRRVVPFHELYNLRLQSN